MKEKLYEYELVQYAGYSVPRKYRIFRFTEKEAYEKNQAYALNNVKKRLVKVEKRDVK